MRGLCALVAAALVAVSVAAASTADAVPRRVLIVGDSVGTGMLWHPAAVAAMQKGLAVDWQVEICRTLLDPGCPFDGERPPSLVDVVAQLRRVPQVVVVELGYNDPEATFSADLDTAMAALVRSGARHVLWLTLHDVRDPYPDLNRLLGKATERWPQLELVDWKNDFVHLRARGGVAMAHLVHGAVMRHIDPLRVVGRALRLRTGHTYTLRLQAKGGTPPYRWRIGSGRPPHGFHLLANGHVQIRLSAGTDASFEVSVTDADGVAATIPAVAG